MGKRTQQKRKESKVIQRFTMYPPPNPDEGRADVSQDNARDIVEAIDAIIRLRVIAMVEGYRKGDLEDIEKLKRQITDYLLVTDPRAGVFRKPE